MALETHDTARHSLSQNTASVSALVVAALTLLLAVVAATVGIRELHAAVTFERRALHLVGLRALALREQLDADAALADFLANHRPEWKRRYTTTERAARKSLLDLAIATREMHVNGGAQLVTKMLQLHDDWSRAAAHSVLQRRLPRHQAAIARIRSQRLLDQFRHHSDRLVFAIFGRLKSDGDVVDRQVLSVAVSLACAVMLCAASVAIAGRRQMQIMRAENAFRERAILFEQSRASARAFQRAILPPTLPTVSGCTFDALYEAGANDAQVGGDWYDAVRLSDGRILVSIGDVAGSGLEAAVVMGIARQIMRGIAQVHANPALMLDAADRALQLEYADVFVTAWVGVIDLVTQTLSYASAGHPPPLLADRSGSVRELGETALPLGLRQGHDAAPTTVGLSDGATLVLYTDGLSEATHDVLAGSERVWEAARCVAAEPCPRPAAAIARRVLPNRASDDVAILVVRMDFAAVEQHVERVTFALDDGDMAHDARNAFIAVLARNHFSANERFEAELVFGELVANVVRHAAGSTRIEVACDCTGPQIVLHVLDRGPGFRHIGRLPADLYSESGRGLYLIAALTDDFSVSERPDGGSHARAVFVSYATRPKIHEAAPARETGSLRTVAARSVEAPRMRTEAAAQRTHF